MGIDKPENMKRFSEMAPHATCWVGYGQTETMVFSSCPFSEKPGSAGKPCVLSRVALFDDYDREVPVGTPGEICVRSPLVFSGYWGHEEENAYISRNGWHHTGDMGRFDKEGYLWYMGRKANRELIKPGGENVFPAEVEKAILDHEAVAEVVVIGVPDQEWGEAIKAVCTVQPGRSLEPQELIDYVASKIARYKKPKHVIFVDAMPKTPEGEMDREKVKKEHGGPQ